MIIIITSVVIFLIIALLFIKRLIIKMLRVSYEKSLLKGDKERAHQLGKSYYLSLDENTRRAKGIVDIETKISNDFRAFNSRNSSIL